MTGLCAAVLSLYDSSPRFFLIDCRSCELISVFSAGAGLADIHFAISALGLGQQLDWRLLFDHNWMLRNRGQLGDASGWPGWVWFCLSVASAVA